VARPTRRTDYKLVITLTISLALSWVLVVVVAFAVVRSNVSACEKGVNSDIEVVVRVFCNNDQDNWATLCPVLELMLNSRTNSALSWVLVVVVAFAVVRSNVSACEKGVL
jgi:hypothetical protein